MELAVMRDSKSRAVTPRAGSTPASGTTSSRENVDGGIMHDDQLSAGCCPCCQPPLKPELFDMEFLPRRIP
jgi:hypothetical protein